MPKFISAFIFRLVYVIVKYWYSSLCLLTAWRSNASSTVWYGRRAKWWRVAVPVAGPTRARVFLRRAHAAARGSEAWHKPLWQHGVLEVSLIFYSLHDTTKIDAFGIQWGLLYPVSRCLYTIAYKFEWYGGEWFAGEILEKAALCNIDMPRNFMVFRILWSSDVIYVKNWRCLNI